MKKESLIELRDMINEYLINKAEMEELDRLELIINMNHFLEPKVYDENVKVLKIEQDKRKWER